MIYKDKTGKSVTQLTWVPPTTREDGSGYGFEDHKNYELGISEPDSATDGITPYISFPAELKTTSWPLDQLNLNTLGDVEVALRTVDNEGATGAWSSLLVFTVALARVSAPTGLSVS